MFELQAILLARLGLEGLKDPAGSAKFQSIINAVPEQHRDDVLSKALALHHAWSNLESLAGDADVGKFLLSRGWAPVTQLAGGPDRDSITYKGIVIIDTPSGGRLFRTIKNILPPGSSLDDIREDMNRVIGDWARRYAGNTYTIVEDSLEVF